MTTTTQLRVLDFDCPTCANTVERSLGKVEGVTNVDVHYTTGRIEIEYDPELADTGEFETTIENQGYSPQPV